jgi:hypothetical protein
VKEWMQQLLDEDEKKASTANHFRFLNLRGHCRYYTVTNMLSVVLETSQESTVELNRTVAELQSFMDEPISKKSLRRSSSTLLDALW